MQPVLSVWVELKGIFSLYNYQDDVDVEIGSLVDVEESGTLVDVDESGSLVDVEEIGSLVDVEAIGSLIKNEIAVVLWVSSSCC